MPLSDTSLLIIYASAYLILSFYWSIKDPRGIKGRFFSYIEKESRKRNLVALTGTTIMTVSAIGIRIPSSNETQSMFQIAGLLLFFTGALIALWGRIELGTSWGPPAHTPEQSTHSLVTTGLYRYTRNPIYLGIFLMSVGLALGFVSPSLVLCLFVYWIFSRVISEEERMLQKKYKDQFEAYKRKTPRLFPHPFNIP